MSTDQKNKPDNVVRLGKRAPPAAAEPEATRIETSPERLAEIVGTVTEPEGQSRSTVSSLASLAAGTPRRVTGGFKFRRDEDAGKTAAVVEPLPGGRPR